MATIDFEGDLDAFAKQVGIDYDIVVKRVALNLFERIVKKTPVDTGRARASWNISIGEPVFAIAPEDGAPPMTEADIRAKASRMLAASRRLTEPIWITNNLPYIGVLEFGGYPKPVKFGSRLKKKYRHGVVKYEVRSIDGYSVKAPHGMVAISIEEVTLKMNLLTKVPT